MCAFGQMHKVLGLDLKPIKPRKSAALRSKDEAGVRRSSVRPPSCRGTLFSRLFSPRHVQLRRQLLDSSARQGRELLPRWRKKRTSSASTANKENISSSRSAFRGNPVSNNAAVCKSAHARVRALTSSLPFPFQSQRTSA